MAAMKFRLHRFEKVTILATYFPKSVVLDTNRLEQRSGPTYVGPDLGFSLFANVQNTDQYTD